MVTTEQIEEMPVVSDPKNFDKHSGNLLERMVFNHRFTFIIVCALITIFLGWQASHIKLSASYDKMIPHNHPYIKNYLKLKGELAGLGNVVRIVVENKKGTIYDAGYLDLLRQINDEVMLTPGTDRAWIRSLWMAGVRWNSVTEEGFLGGPVMPDGINMTLATDKTVKPEDLAVLQDHIVKANIIGALVARDMKSSMIVAPLQDKEPDTGLPLDYNKYAKALEKIRAKQTDQYRIHIVGFAKLIGDLIDGITKVMLFFLAALVIAGVIVFVYTRCIRSTITLLVCSLIAVTWLLGLLVTFHYDLDPYSVLVPFLVFAIGVSHGAQKMNGIMQDIGRGTHKLIAARYTFRRLFLAGLTALLADTVGFAVLMMINIPVIRDLAMTASMGVAILIFTNLLLLPVMLSFFGVSSQAAMRSLREESDETSMVSRAGVALSKLTERRWATIIVVCSILVSLVGLTFASRTKIGDLDPGAPELRPNSRYNLDNAYINAHYELSSDVFAIMVNSPLRMGTTFEAVVDMDRLQWALQQLPSVQASYSAADGIKEMTSGTAEGSPKWYTLSRNQNNLDYASTWVIQNKPDLANTDVSVLPVVVYLKDHKAETLEKVVATCEKFAKEHDTKDRQFLLAAGSAGIEAATNIEVEKANRTMMAYVYLAIIILCFITFRNWRAVLVAIIPLGITSILCEALMAILGIGVKVATLPVIALGVGIGVDYALYLVSVVIKHQRDGLPLTEAYLRALRFTGKVVALVGVTLAAGVLIWAFSPIKFQADMGILLGFMFLWNMIGALVVIPALAHFIMQTKWIEKKKS